MMSSPDVGGYFDARVRRYDSAYESFDSDGHALRARLDAVLRRAGSGPGDALDAGMGPGRLAAELERLGWTVSGVDASLEMVSVARKRLPGSAQRFTHGRIESLPFPDESFDLVTATGVLEYSSVASALAELARVTRPGGRLIVSYPNAGSICGIWKSRAWYPAVRRVKSVTGRAGAHRPDGAGAIAAERVVRMLEGAGIAVETFDYVSFLALPAPLDTMFPAVSARAGERLERRGAHARRLGTQIVFDGVKDATAVGHGAGS
jgi:SAM-dependent methyltransferase